MGVVAAIRRSGYGFIRIILAGFRGRCCSTGGSLMTYALTLSPWGGSRLPDIRQAEAAECGLACLAMIAGYHGRHMDLGTLRRRHPISVRGASLRSVMSLAGELDLAARPLRLEMGHLSQIKTPAILHWDMDHFVVLKRASRTSIDIHDPATGTRRYSYAEAGRHFTGVALELSPTQDFTRKLRTFAIAAEGGVDLAAQRRVFGRSGTGAVRGAAGLRRGKPVLHAACRR